MLVLLSVVLLACKTVESGVVFPLSCPQHLANLIYLRVNASAFVPPQPLNYGELVLQATQLSTNRTFNNTCGEEIQMCKWNLDENQSGKYRLRLLNLSQHMTKVWSYGDNVFELPQDLFYCFKHDFRPFSHSMVNRTTYQVQWHTRRWVDKYNLISYHNVSVEEVSRKTDLHFASVHMPNNRCHPIQHHGRNCEVQFSGLKPCANYRVCIITQFKSSTNTLRQCIQTHLSTHHPECNRDMMPVYAASVIAVLAAVLGIAGFVVIRRRLGLAESEEKYGSGDIGVITPRHDYTEMQDVRNVGGEAVYFVVNNAAHGSHQQHVDDHEQQPNTSSRFT